MNGLKEKQMCCCCMCVVCMNKNGQSHRCIVYIKQSKIHDSCSNSNRSPIFIRLFEDVWQNVGQFHSTETLFSQKCVTRRTSKKASNRMKWCGMLWYCMLLLFHWRKKQQAQHQWMDEHSMHYSAVIHIRIIAKEDTDRSIHTNGTLELLLKRQTHTHSKNRWKSEYNRERSNK